LGFAVAMANGNSEFFADIPEIKKGVSHNPSKKGQVVSICAISNAYRKSVRISGDN
jgi:hypothetical protein